MSKKFLATTRNIVTVAAAITGFIIRNADFLERIAKALHITALDRVEAAAHKAVDKAYAKYAGLQAAVAAASKAASAEYAKFEAAASKAATTTAGVSAEKATL